MRRVYWRPLKAKLIECLECGMTDAEAAKHLSTRKRKISRAQVLNKRHHMEKRGEIPMGLAASSKLNGKTKKKNRKIQRWSAEADAFLTEMAERRQPYDHIAKEMVKRGLREVYSPGATSRRASTLGVAWGRWKGPSKSGDVPKLKPVKARKPEQAELPFKERETMILTLVSKNGDNVAAAYTMNRRDAELIMGLCQWMKERELVSARG